MCGRYTLTTDIQTVSDRFEAPLSETYKDIAKQFASPSFNIAPSTYRPVIINKENKNILTFMKWGLVPVWAKDEKIGYKMINARAESIAQKPSFKRPLQKQRCVIPATGFYEWKKEGKNKQPFYFKLKSQQLFGFAGLYDIWTNEQGKDIYTYTIITVKPNELVKPIHDRMPAILNKSDEKEWLNYEKGMVNKLTLLKSYKEKEMELYPVSKSINSPKNNDASLTLPLDD